MSKRLWPIFLGVPSYDEIYQWYDSFFYPTWIQPHTIFKTTFRWKTCNQHWKWVYKKKGIAYSPTCLNISITFSRKCSVSTSIFSSCFANFNCGAQSRSAPNMYYDKKDKNLKPCVIPLNDVTCSEKTSDGSQKNILKKSGFSQTGRNTLPVRNVLRFLFRHLFGKAVWNTSKWEGLGQSGQKKVVLFPEIGRGKIFLSPTRPHSRMCIRIYF